MNSKLFKAYLRRNGDTQKSLADEMGLSLSRINAKINQTGGAEFMMSEILWMADHWKLTNEEVCLIFFNR